jgi:hypothetical protein|tara:strand:- start:1969 stop:2163 length:195 start_codon:yes stop_codon:yes gene_type:complete
VSILVASLVYSEVEDIMTFTELCERLENLDEETVMELLEIDIRDLVARFEDRVELHNERLQKEL